MTEDVVNALMMMKIANNGRDIFTLQQQQQQQQRK